MAPSKTWTRPSAMRSLRVGRIRSGFLAGCLTWPQYAANRHDGAPSGQGSGVGTASPARGATATRSQVLEKFPDAKHSVVSSPRRQGPYLLPCGYQLEATVRLA